MNLHVAFWSLCGELLRNREREREKKGFVIKYDGETFWCQNSI